MNQETSQAQLNIEIAPFTQVVRNTRAIRQHEALGAVCERLHLYALAAHAFRRLAQVDSANRSQHGQRFLHNRREASGTGLSGAYAANYN